MSGEQERAAGASFALLSDQPSTQGIDPLGFDDVAGELARLVLRSRASTPFALGIEGVWGSGKSTLMERLRLHLEADPTVATVTFNAWTAAEHDVAEGLVKTVLDKLDRGAVRRALRNEQLVGWVRVAVSVAAGWLHLGSVVDLFWREAAIDPQTRNKMRELVEQAVAEWTRQRRDGMPEGRLLCVVIDDLDRCSSRVVMEVLEAVKLYLNVPGVVFVIGYDQAIVSEVVLHERGYDATKGRDYLEKFIQIKYRLSRPPLDRSRELVRSLLQASSTDELFGQEQLDLLVDRNASNPRRIKRFINDFVLAYGMDPAWREFEPATLVRVQLLNAYFEEFARLLSAQETPDPLEEFAEYREAREALRRIASTGPAAVAPAAFKRRELPLPDVVAPDDVARLLRALEDELPLAFPAFADDRELWSLVERLRAAADWEPLRRRLLGRELVLDVEPSGQLAVGDGVQRLDGLSVLWVDDRHEGNARLLHELQQLGAEVELANGTEHAAAWLARRRFDVLISDIERDGEPDAGFDALERFRAREIAPLTVVFFAARVTGARAVRARELGASITSRGDELVAALATAAVRVQPDLVPVAFDVLSTSADTALAERLRRDLSRAITHGYSIQFGGRPAPGVDVMFALLGRGWQDAPAHERVRLVEQLRTFAAGGSEVFVALSSDISREEVERLAVGILASLPVLVQLNEDTWSGDVDNMALAAERLVQAKRLGRRAPA